MRSTRKDACLFTLVIGEKVQEAVPCGLVRIMKIKDDDKTSGTEPSAAASKINGTGAGPANPEQPFIPGPPSSASELVKKMEKSAQSLVVAYLAANLDFKDLPLKQFLDNCEKKILLDCLHLTVGSQKNAAALLGIKPTALFEKMRKYGIKGQRFKLSEKLKILPPHE